MNDLNSILDDHLGTSRSVCIQEDLGEFHMQQGFRAFPGDFYGAHDDVTRGAAMGTADSIYGAEVAGGSSASGWLGDLDSADVLGIDMQGYGISQETDSSPCAEFLEAAKTAFTNDYDPHYVPDDEFFKLAVTTRQVKLNENERAAVIAHALLTFLAQQVRSSITKLRAANHKSWIKADVFATSARLQPFAMCTIKIRIYKVAADQTFAIEFMRCSGDSLAFNNVFHEAIRYLKSASNQALMYVDDESDPPADKSLPVGFSLSAGAQTACDDDARAELAMQSGCLPAPLAMADAHEIDSHEQNAVCLRSSFTGREVDTFLAPVLDMAAMKSQPSLQAESAATLAHLAERDATQAKGLCTSEVFDAVRNLLKADLISVIFPTARLLCQLASYQEAERLFADGQLLQDILAKISKGQSSLVTGQLAQVLSVSVEHFAKKFSAKFTTALLNVLQSTIREVQFTFAKLSLLQVEKVLRASEHTAEVHKLQGAHGQYAVKDGSGF